MGNAISFLAISLIASGLIAVAAVRYPLIERDAVQTGAPPGYIAYHVRLWGTLYSGRAAAIRMEKLPFDDKERPTLSNFDGDIEPSDRPDVVSRIFFPSTYAIPKEIAEIDAGPPPNAFPKARVDLAVFHFDQSASSAETQVYRGVLPFVLSGTILGRVDAGPKPAGAYTALRLAEGSYWFGEDFRLHPADARGQESILRVPMGQSLPTAFLAK